MSVQTCNQAEFISALASGERNFCKVTFVGKISADKITMADYPVEPVDSLILDYCKLGPGFYFDGFSQPEAKISLVGASGKVVAFCGVQAQELVATDICIDWFSLQNSSVSMIRFPRGLFRRGFMLRGNQPAQLDLSKVDAERAVYLPEHYKLVGKPWNIRQHVHRTSLCKVREKFRQAA